MNGQDATIAIANLPPPVAHDALWRAVYCLGLWALVLLERGATGCVLGSATVLRRLGTVVVSALALAIESMRVTATVLLR